MNLKIKIISCLLSALSPIMMTAATTDSHYTPSPEVISSQKEFETDRFGIFIHWGIYSMFARGEWYLNYGPKADEYAKAAKGFYPADFDASAWVSAIKDSGARYICFTTVTTTAFQCFTLPNRTII